MKKYMLLIEGMPAYFDGQQIVFANRNYRGAGVKVSQMYDSRVEAAKVFKKSRDYRKSKGYIDGYSYLSIPIDIDLTTKQLNKSERGKNV